MKLHVNSSNQILLKLILKFSCLYLGSCIHEFLIYNFLLQLKALERSHQAIREELKSAIFYARLTLLMTVIVAFMVMFLPYFTMTNGCATKTEDQFQSEFIKSDDTLLNHEL